MVMVGPDPLNQSADSPSRQPTSNSCVVCHNRKVKCDRQDPCSNCAKADVECIYRAPPPPRRRKREETGSVSQGRGKSLRRMEPGSGSATPNRGQMGQASTNHTKKSGSGRMIMKDGNSVYLDTNLWTSVSNELPDAADVLGDVSDSAADDSAQDVDGDSILLLTSTTRENLTGLHPSPLHIFKLWQAFLENVNPLTKIVHAPTVQQQILEAMSDLPNINKDLEALMFSIYCIALVSLQAADVEKSFGESKKALLLKCRRGAQLGFKNASLLRTSSSMVLQAFMLYLLCMRSFSDPHTIWTLCGIATRIAQRIGIHRDGSSHGISVFDTEIRRRIWFQLMIIDATSAQFCGVASTPLPGAIDVQPPMNANDSDLDPRMTEPAYEKEGATEMIFCLARSAFGKWLHRWSKEAEGTNTSPWYFLTASSLTLNEKDRAIDELEAHMKDKFFRHCDTSIPLHIATSMMASSAIHYTRLMAHHPRQYPDPTRIPQSEKDIIFEHALKMTEHADYAQTCSAVQKYSWHMVNHIPWDAIVLLLSDMRHRRNHEEKSKVWHLIGNVYSRNLQESKGIQTPLHRAIQTLIVKAWRAYIDECNQHHRTPTPCPTIVATLLASAKGTGTYESQSQPLEEIGVVENGASQDQPEHDFPTARFDPADGFEFLLGDSPIDWNEWDTLLNQFPASLPDDAT